ncbi:MAG TPA: DoxX family protein [Xanthomonadales bacterium]|nr:DoxX family protein [Xanthomonadales bacterium]
MRLANDSLGKLVLRLVLGLVVLLHGIAKLRGGVEGITGMVEGLGLPGFLGYAVLIGEVLGPVLLLAGFYARIGALLIALNMVVAIALAHMGEVLALNPQGGWAIELQAMLLFGALAAMLLGPGKPAFNDR